MEKEARVLREKLTRTGKEMYGNRGPPMKEKNKWMGGGKEMYGTGGPSYRKRISGWGEGKKWEQGAPHTGKE